MMVVNSSGRRWMLMLVWTGVYLCGCASQTPAGPGGAPPSVPAPAPSDQPPQSGEGDAPRFVLPPAEMRGEVFQLVRLLPAVLPADDPAAASRREAGHREHLDALRSAGIQAISGAVDDGSYLLILGAQTPAWVGDYTKDDPLVRDHRELHTAAFKFTVGGLCDEPPKGDERQLEMVWFERDREVLVNGGELAPAPFAAEVGQLAEVVAAGAWGLGHLGAVFLDVGSEDEARDVVAAWPIPLDPQWSVQVHRLTLAQGSLCR